ncbi:Subtilisin-like protease SBT4.11 [Camellia lanceoleosa]|uniref:Subtilisin-like protease SBT4.11 n=1 Tax=Camellia lanceoleosa TaxID=1840588 RepID=A0ACC0GDB0_9ERIC|nr:Subtilisin-like protease SBT4.11 [Camellia lanceoleosa]
MIPNSNATTGNLVKNASFGKLKIGMVRGGVPAARISIYKLVFGSLRYGFMTRAFTAAIEDKVDILILSIGHPNDDEKIKMRESNYFDEIELGTYEAMLHDILSCTAARNDSATTKNVAHGHGVLQPGFSINQFRDTESCSLIYSKNARAPIGATGVDVVCANSEEVKGAKENFPFTMASGTSMATVVVSSAVAFVKSFHPTWSSSAIKLALMTTEVDERMKTKMDTEVDQALRKPEKEIYQVYFDASGDDKASLHDHKKFLEDVFDRDEALEIKRWYPVELLYQ